MFIPIQTIHYIPIDHANFDGVTFDNGKPYCKKHGAMNKVSKHQDGGGYWRCISVVNNSGSTICRSGCEQKIK